MSFVLKILLYIVTSNIIFNNIFLLKKNRYFDTNSSLKFYGD